MEPSLISQRSISFTRNSRPSISVTVPPANSGQRPWMSRRVTFSYHRQSIIWRYRMGHAQVWRSPESWSGSLRVITSSSPSRLSQILKTLSSSRISACTKFMMEASNICRSITRSSSSISNREVTCLKTRSTSICILRDCLDIHARRMKCSNSKIYWPQTNLVITLFH